MLTKTAVFTFEADNIGYEFTITPLFFQNHAEPWQPNEIFEILETRRSKNGTWTAFEEPKDTGKLIIDEHQNWRYEGDSGLTDDELQKIADFVLLNP